MLLEFFISKDAQNLMVRFLVNRCHSDSFKRFPYTRRYRGFREMLEREVQNIVDVVIASPDLHHAPEADALFRKLDRKEWEV